MPPSWGFPLPSGSGIIIYMRNKTATPALGAGRRAEKGPKVATVIYDGFGLFEFGVAAEVFGYNRARVLDVPWYRWFVCAATESVTASGGITVQASYGLAHVRNADIVVVTPTDGFEDVPEAVLDALRAAHRRGARILSLCTGAFVLAAAGLLDGRRATTHWAHCAALHARHPEISVDECVLYVDEGDILTSAGSAASIDLCLHVVRHDYGAEVASRLARRMVVAPHRDGGQAQYIDVPMSPADPSDLFAESMTWLQEHLDEPVSIAKLAERSAMSTRTFARRFLATTGTTPYQWLIRQRLQLAQRYLETTDWSVDRVAERSGFVTAPNLRKHFNRAVRVSPQAYRQTFQCVDDDCACSA
jgi:AraC family transcriptional activator FtrA